MGWIGERRVVAEEAEVAAVDYIVYRCMAGPARYDSRKDATLNGTKMRRTDVYGGL